MLIIPDYVELAREEEKEFGSGWIPQNYGYVFAGRGIGQSCFAGIGKIMARSRKNRQTSFMA